MQTGQGPNRKEDAWKAWIWQQNFLVFISYDTPFSQERASVSLIFDVITAQRLVAGIIAAERIMQKIIEEGDKRDPWRR